MRAVEPPPLLHNTGPGRVGHRKSSTQSTVLSMLLATSRTQIARDAKLLAHSGSKFARHPSMCMHSVTICSSPECAICMCKTARDGRGGAAIRLYASLYARDACGVLDASFSLSLRVVEFPCTGNSSLSLLSLSEPWTSQSSARPFKLVLRVASRSLPPIVYGPSRGT